MGVDEFFCMLREKMPDVSGPPEEISHDRSKALVVYLGEVSVHDNNKVEPFRYAVHVEPEVFAQPPLHAVPRHRSTNTTADGHAQACIRSGAVPDEEAQPSPGNLFTPPQDFLEGGPPSNTVHPRKAIRHQLP